MQRTAGKFACGQVNNNIQLAHKDGMVKANINSTFTGEYFTHSVQAWFGAVPVGQLKLQNDFFMLKYLILQQLK